MIHDPIYQSAADYNDAFFKDIKKEDHLHPGRDVSGKRQGTV